MACGQGQSGIAGTAPRQEARQIARDGPFEHGAMPRAGNPIEYDASYRDTGIVPRESGDQCRDRGALPLASTTSTTGQPVRRAEFGGRAVSPSGGAVEEHDLPHDDVGRAFEPADEPGKRRRAHRHGSRLRHGALVANA